MKVVCKFSRMRVAADAGHDLHLLVRLRAPVPPAEVARPALCIVPVVDVSGSMAGRKIEAVRYALERLMVHLVPGDRAGLVTFDSTVRTPVPLVEVTAARKNDLRRAIQSLRPGSNTNLAGGLLEAIQLVRKASLPAGMRARLIVLTDGLANEGPATTPETLTSLCRAELKGLTLSAFGYGDDCDQTLLSELASTSGGSYAYIQNHDQVLTAFGRELGGLVATYAAEVKLRVVPLAGAPLEESLGDLLYHGELSCVMPVAAPINRRAEGVDLAVVEATWRDARGQTQQLTAPARVDYVRPAEADAADDPEVLRASDERKLRQAQELAEARARRANYTGARQAIRDVIGLLNDAQLAAFARDVLLPCYQDQLQYTMGSGVRASALTLLRGARQVSMDNKVAAAFRDKDHPTLSEHTMEQSFRNDPERKSKS